MECVSGGIEYFILDNREYHHIDPDKGAGVNREGYNLQSVTALNVYFIVLRQRKMNS